MDGSVRFTNSSTGNASFSKPVKKVSNFFDDDDDDFETFNNDKDFARMTVSLNGKTDKVNKNEDESMLGQPWGGKAYSLQTDEAKPPIPSSARTRSSSDQTSTSLSTRQKPTQISESKPSFPRASTTTSKSTKTSQYVAVKTSSPASASSVTSHETVSHTSTTSIENVVENTKSQMTDAERNRLIAEVKQLKKDVLVLRQASRKTPKPSETVKKLVLNEPCVLELFRSLDEKLALLDEAIKIGDGNALITVLLFIKKTVNNKIFHREISRRPVAVRHIVSYMKAHYDYADLIQLLRHLGRKEEAMMLEYKKALSLPNPDLRLEAIHACERSYDGAQDLADMVGFLREHQNLIKRQIQIEVKDKKTQAEGRDAVMNQHPRRRVVLSPIISTLEYCSLYHYAKGDETLDPLSIKKDFKLNDKQYEWSAIAARAQLKKWSDLESLFTAKGWFGGNKLKSSLGFDKVVGVLQKSNAPPDILAKYLAFVEVPETRLALATSLQSHKVAVETIVAMKDKQKLMDYRNQIDCVHPVQSLISSYLQNSQIKWK